MMDITLNVGMLESRASFNDAQPTPPPPASENGQNHGHFFSAGRECVALLCKGRRAKEAPAVNILAE